MLDVLGGVVEQPCAQTHGASCPLENVVIAAGGTAAPEFLVAGQLAKVHRTKAQLGVEFEDGSAGGDAENFCSGVQAPREFERCVLDPSCDAVPAIIWRDDQTGVGNVAPVLPGFDLAKPSESRAVPIAPSIERDDRFPFAHLLANVFRWASCDARAALEGGFFDKARNRFGVAFV